MRKLTKKQRHEIYKKALHSKDGNIAIGLCLLFQDMFGICTYHYWEYSNKNNRLNLNPDVELPELYMVSDCECYWSFNGCDPVEIREILLMFCIEMTK